MSYSYFFYPPAQFGDGVMKPTGTDEKPAQELTATPDAATVQHKKTWLLPCLCPLKTIIMYQYDAWSWIRVWVNTVLKLPISEYGKVLYSSRLDNGEFNLLRSPVITKAICAEEHEGCMGLAGQRITLMQFTPSIIIIHRLLLPQSISGEWKCNITL